jgi:hypothetical protein
MAGRAPSARRNPVKAAIAGFCVVMASAMTALALPITAVEDGPPREMPAEPAATPSGSSHADADSESTPQPTRTHAALAAACAAAVIAWPLARKAWDSIQRAPRRRRHGHYKVRS